MTCLSLGTLRQKGRYPRTRTSLVSLATAALVTFAISTSALAEDVVRFGASLSLTGAKATEGRLVKDGYDFYVKHVNKIGGIPSPARTTRSRSSTTTTRAIPRPRSSWSKS